MNIMRIQETKAKGSNGVALGFEDTLWKMADKLRSNMDAAEYKHVVLGLIFLKYVNDMFSNLYRKLVSLGGQVRAENMAEYKTAKVFWVPQIARWEYIKSKTKTQQIGVTVNEAMSSIEKHNTSLSGVLPKVYDKQSLDKQRLSGLIQLVGTVDLGGPDSQHKDVLGRVYEYFLGQFADAEGLNGGQFYTPRSIVKLLVEMVEPYQGIVYDPCCGSGGMFVQSESFIRVHNGRPNGISIFGQESNLTTWQLCRMNLAIRGIECNIQYGDSFMNDLHRDLRADFILANPPFNDSDWEGELLQLDPRWVYGIPPRGNANFAWIQHFIYHLNTKGVAGFVLTNGALSSNSSQEYPIRKSMVTSDLVDCIVALPDRLFYNTQIAASLWFIAKDKTDSRFRSRKEETLFINAKFLGDMTSRRHRELSDYDILKVADAYHRWRNRGGSYEDVQGFCRSSTMNEIVNHNYALVPGRYTGCLPFSMPSIEWSELEEAQQILRKRMSQLKESEAFLLRPNRSD